MQTVNRMMFVSCGWRGFLSILSPSGGTLNKISMFSLSELFEQEVLYLAGKFCHCLPVACHFQAVWKVMNPPHPPNNNNNHKNVMIFTSKVYFMTLETELSKLQPENDLIQNVTSTALKITIWCLLNSGKAGWII